MIRKFNLSIFMWDEVLDAVLVEHSVLGPEIRLAERLPRSHEVLAELGDKIAKLEINDLFVRVSIPRESVLLRTVSYPAVVKENLETMLPLEANRHLPLPENDRAIAWTTAENDDELLLEMVAVKQSALNELLAPLAEAGLKADYALPASAFLAQWTDEKPTLILVNDAQHAEVILCSHGLLRETVLLNQPNAEKVVDTAQRMLVHNRKWLGDEGVTQIIGTGPIALSEELQNELSVTFGLTAKPLTAPDEENTEPVEALRAAMENLPETLNLTEARARKFTMTRRTITISALAAVLLIQLIAWPILFAQAPRAAQDRLNRKIRQLKKESGPFQKMKTEIRQMRDELSGLEKLSQDQLSMMQVLKIVSDTLPEDSYLTRIRFNKERELSLTGQSKNPSALSGILLELPFVADITKSDSKERSNSEYSNFTLNFTVKDMTHE